MKDIKTYIIEAAKFNYWKDVIEFPGYELKVPKKYIKSINSTKYYQSEFLEKYFGWINQWLDKNVKNIIKEITKDNDKEFPKEIWIMLPSKLSGKLRLEWDCGWSDGVPSGKLSYVEIDVNHVSPSSMSHSSFYQAKEDLNSFKLINEIKF